MTGPKAQISLMNSSMSCIKLHELFLLWVIFGRVLKSLKNENHSAKVETGNYFSILGRNDSLGSEGDKTIEWDFGFVVFKGFVLVGWFWKFRQIYFSCKSLPNIFNHDSRQYNWLLALILQILIKILDSSPGDLFINFVPHRPDHSILWL